MKYMTFLEPAMMSHVVGILLKEGQPTKYYSQVSIGQPFLRMQRSMWLVVMILKRWGSQPQLMKCLFKHM
jgi:hypothetical protein